MAHQLYETQLAELTTKCQKNENLINEIYTKNLYLEAYSRRENIKFMNIEESTGIGGRSGEDTEEVLRNFLERDLGYREARNEEIQRVHRIGKSKDGNPRPVLARFLRYKDCQQILLLGHRLKGTNFQMFRDLPQEIITRRKVQMGAFKDARRNGVAASFSQSQPDKLIIIIIIIITITLIVKSSKGFSSTIYNNICIPKNNKNIEKFKNLKLRESLP